MPVRPKLTAMAESTLIHDALVRVAHVLAQAAFVDGADLLEQDDGVLIQPHVVPGERNVRREPRLAGLAGDGGGDDGWRVFVAGVVLNDEHGRVPPCSLPTTGLRSA